MTTTELNVVGMTCSHCEHAVKAELSDLPGVSDVTVALNPGAESHVTVVSAAPLSHDALAGAIDEAGYELA